MTVRDELGDELGTDQPGPADNDDLHDDLSFVPVARLALQESEYVGVDVVLMRCGHAHESALCGRGIDKDYGRLRKAAIASVELPSPARVTDLALTKPSRYRAARASASNRSSAANSVRRPNNPSPR